MPNNKSSATRGKLVWKKTNGICAHCGKFTVAHNRTVDHYIPRSDHGGYDIRNLMPLCQSCNYVRGSARIDPFVFYSYAKRSDILACLDYEQELIASRRSMSGDVW